MGAAQARRRDGVGIDDGCRGLGRGIRRCAGDAGRRGDTVGTLICENFECPQNVRKLPPSAYLGFDREAARDRRIESLREHVEGFVRDVRGLG